MTVRTISDLTSADTLVANDLFEISHPTGDGSKYASQKIKYETLESTIINKAKLSCENVWSIDENTNIKQLKTNVEQLSAVMNVRPELGGQPRAVFSKSPISTGNCHFDYEIPNKLQVIDLVRDNCEFITPTSYTEANVMNDRGYTNYDKDNLYLWHIDNGQRDSSLWVNEQGLEDGPRIIQDAGYLVIYGWLASNQEVTAQEAWVGLYANLPNTNSSIAEEKHWVLLQVQPWIVGKNSQLMQYVGFNVPVQANLELKIMTGFKVNGTGSALHIGNTLMFNNEGNMPNTFVGYVIKN